MIGRLLLSLVRSRVVGVRIDWHAWRVGRLTAATEAHQLLLLRLAADADRELARLERVGYRRTDLSDPTPTVGGHDGRGTDPRPARKGTQR